ncbi:MAG: SDR family NAD(P)-dependent oxidoreductase [Candidatus Binatia bacterium]
MEETSKTVLITGASVGIGYELARVFAREGYALVLVSRDRNALQRVAEELGRDYKAVSKIISADLSLPSSSREIFEELEREGIEIDVLVNNAGFGVFGPFSETDLEQELSMLQVHLSSLTHLTKRCLKKMLERGAGKILNVASTAAFQPGPMMAVYYATKAYQVSFSGALASELRGSGVTVSVLCPGPTRTEFQKRAGMAPSKLFNRFAMDSADVAQAGYRGLMRGDTLIIPGFVNRFLALIVRFVPRGFAAATIRRIQAKQVKR